MMKKYTHEKPIVLLQFDVHNVLLDTLYSTPIIPLISIDKVIATRTLKCMFIEVIEKDTFYKNDEKSFRYIFEDDCGNPLYIDTDRVSYGKGIDKRIFINPNGCDYVDAEYYRKLVYVSIKKLEAGLYLCRVNSDTYDRKSLIIQKREEHLFEIDKLIQACLF